jgi:glycosyltransferase involved in cell wall biosynthesis
MRVAVFTDNDFDKINGVTTALTAVLRHAPPDIKPRIYTAAGLGCDAPDYLALASYGVGIPFYRELKMYVPRWRAYLDQVRADGVDLIHLTTPGPLGLVALWVASQTGLPIVGSFHTDLSAYTRLLSGSDRLGHWMQQYMRWMYGRCACVLVPSEATRQLMIAAGSRAERLRVWSRGVDTDWFTPARRSERLRADWRVSADRPALLYVGRLSKEKGLALLPQLQSALRQRGVGHRWIITGEGPMRAELERNCPDAAFTGPLGRAEVANTFASADLFVFPSRTDTAGNVVLEAQASGVPVVVSDAGGPSENLRLGLSGTVCCGQDAEAWADHVAAFASRPDAREAASVHARAYALSRNWDSALMPLFDAYREVAGRSGSRAA